MSIRHKRVKMKSCSFCIMLKVLENKTQIHSSIVALVIQQNNNKVPCFTLYTQLCTKIEEEKHTFYLSSGNLVIFQYTILFSFHISLQGKKKFIYSSRYEKRWLSRKLFCDLHVSEITTLIQQEKLRKIYIFYGSQ